MGRPVFQFRLDEETELLIKFMRRKKINISSLIKTFLFNWVYSNELVLNEFREFKNEEVN